MGLFLVAALPCALAAATGENRGNATDTTTRLSNRAAPVLTEFTARLRCRSKSGASIDDSWCRDNYLQSPSADMCICDERPSKAEIACSKVPGWEQPRSYLMAGCSASTFIGRATVEVLKVAGLCPFDFLDTRFRYTTSNNGILLPELLEGTKESHQTAVLNTVPEDLNYIAQTYPKLLNGTRMVHIFRENYLDEIKCRTAGGWAVGQHSKKKFRLTPARMLKEMRDALDNQASTTQQMARMGFGNVALTTEALTQFEFDDSDAGWQRSLDAWQVLTRAWGVKVPLPDIRRALKRVGSPQKPHAKHSDTFANADAIRDALMKAGPPYSSWFRAKPSKTTPVSKTERSSWTTLHKTGYAGADAAAEARAAKTAATATSGSGGGPAGDCISIMVNVPDSWCIDSCQRSHCPESVCKCVNGYEAPPAWAALVPAGMDEPADGSR